MESNRKNPELLLRAISKGKNKTAGELKIFFGYAAGVGKTYAMLESAHEMKEQNVDVAVGYVEPHERPETEALLLGLDSIPVRTAVYNGLELSEFDVDAAIARNPELIIVD